METRKESGHRIQKRIGLACLSLALLCLLPAYPLQCTGTAIVAGGFSLLDGAVFGGALAAVTRTRRTILIYLFLCLAGLTLWPLLVSWPPATEEQIHLWPHAPEILLNYFDVLRPALFLLGFPAPFAWLGHHAPDN